MFGRRAIKHGFKIGCRKTRFTTRSYGTVQITFVHFDGLRKTEQCEYFAECRFSVNHPFKRKNVGSPPRSVVVGYLVETVGEPPVLDRIKGCAHEEVVYEKSIAGQKGKNPVFYNTRSSLNWDSKIIIIKKKLVMYYRVCCATRSHKTGVRRGVSIFLFLRSISSVRPCTTSPPPHVAVIAIAQQ